MKSPRARILCSCKSFKRPIFSFAALLSPHRIFFSCSEIRSLSLETWALYRKSLACTSTNGWFLFAVCSSWCCKGVAKNYQLRCKSRKKNGEGQERQHIGVLTRTFTSVIKPMKDRFHKATIELVTHTLAQDP